MFRVPQGSVPCGAKVTLRVRAEGADTVRLRLWWEDAEKVMEMIPCMNGLYSCSFTLPVNTGLLWYYFIGCRDGSETVYYGNSGDRLGGVGEMTGHEPPGYQITVYDKSFTTPGWMPGAAMMQIMVDRFHASGKPDASKLPAGSFYHRTWNEDPVLICNDRTGDYVNNDFFGGDLKGLEQKLDHLKDFGISVIYLNPIFEARSNHKYDTGDYMRIDPSFGTEEDFSRLCAEARKRGIRVILDGVFSHTGSDSRYFNRNGTYGEGGAYNDPDSPYAKWYTFKTWPNEYKSWWGFRTLPEVNKNEESYREFMVRGSDSVVAHWLKAGASGWRLDVADELPMDFIREIRVREKQVDPEAALIGEVWEDPSNKISYGSMRSYVLGDTLDSTMNYPLREAILSFLRCGIEASVFVRRLDCMRENLPKPFLYSMMNLLSSHDRPRALTVLADVGDMEPDRRMRRAFDLPQPAYELGRRRLIAAWKLICALPGMPCVYYGDEAGMYGMSDPFCRGPYPWGMEDTELREEFRSALARRRAAPALSVGDMQLTAIGTNVVLVVRSIIRGRDVFGRPAKNEKRALAVNRADESRWIEYEGKAVEIPAQSAVWLGFADTEV